MRVTPQVRLSPDGRHLLVFLSNQIDLWDIRSSFLSSSWKEADTITAACFSQDGRGVALATSNGLARFRELQTGAEIFSIAHLGMVRFLEFSPDGKQILTAGDDGRARVWNAADGVPVTPAMLHASPVRHAAFSSNGHQLVTGSDDMTGRIWDAKSGVSVGEPIPLQSPVMSAALNANGTRILTVRDHVPNRMSGATQLWDAATRRPLTAELMLLGPGRYPAAFSPDGRRYFMLHDVTSVAICDAKTGRRTAPLLEHKYLPTGFAFSPD